MTNKITYKELIDAFSEKTGKSKDFSDDFIKDVFAEIEEGLKKDEHVSITGMGIFKNKKVPKRQMFNPQTGESFLKEAHKRVVFKPEKSLRKIVNKKYAHLRAKLIKRKTETTTNDNSKGSALKWLIPLLLVIVIAILFFTSDRRNYVGKKDFEQNREVVSLYEKTEESSTHHSSG